MRPQLRRYGAAPSHKERLRRWCFSPHNPRYKPLAAAEDSQDAQHPMSSLLFAEESDELGGSMSDASSWTRRQKESEKRIPLVRTNGFELAVTISIGLQCILLGVDAEMCGGHGDGCSSSEELVFTICEAFFAFLFLGEWCLKVLEGGPTWLRQPVHILDTLIIWVGGVATTVASLTHEWHGALFLYGLNSLRLLRLVRMFIEMSRFSTFQTLLTGLLESGGKLLAACIVLCGMVLVSGCIAIELIGNSPSFKKNCYAEELHYDRGDAMSVMRSWAEGMQLDCTVSQFQHGLVRSMYTMTRFMTQDDAMDTLVGLDVPHRIDIWIFLLGFMALTTYVLMNIITAIIVDAALQIAQEREMAQATKIQDKEAKRLSELREFCLGLDEDSSGSVSHEELKASLQAPEMQENLVALGFEVSELMQFFEVLDDDASGVVDIQKFLNGLMKIRGEALSVDMLGATKKSEKAWRVLKDFKRKLPQAPTGQTPKGKPRERPHRQSFAYEPLLELLDVTIKRKVEVVEMHCEGLEASTLRLKTRLLDELLALGCQNITVAQRQHAVPSAGDDKNSGGAAGSSSSTKHVTFPKDAKAEVIGRPAHEHKRARRETE